MNKQMKRCPICEQTLIRQPTTAINYYHYKCFGMRTLKGCKIKNKCGYWMIEKDGNIVYEKQIKIKDIFYEKQIKIKAGAIR